MQKFQLDSVKHSPLGEGITKLVVAKGTPLFAQGMSANAIFHIQSGKVIVTVVSKAGKEAVIGILGPGAFVGEGCLAGQKFRSSSATTMTECAITRIEKSAVPRLTSDNPGFSEMLLAHLLARTNRVEEDLLDQLFSSSEKRLARTLLLLADVHGDGPSGVIPDISQEMLARMVGTTRSRVSFFMNKFRRMGLIDYGDSMEVRSSLHDVLQHD